MIDDYYCYDCYDYGCYGCDSYSSAWEEPQPVNDKWEDWKIKYRVLQKELKEKEEQHQKELANCKTALEKLNASFLSSNVDHEEAIEDKTIIIHVRNEEIADLEKANRASKNREYASNVKVGDLSGENVRLETKSRQLDEQLTNTLCNLSNSRQEADGLRGTDAHTASVMKKRIAELECLVFQAAVEKQIEPDEHKRDIVFALSACTAFQTLCRWSAPAIVMMIVAAIMVLGN